MEIPKAIQEVFTRPSFRCFALGQENMNVAPVDIAGIMHGTRPASAEEQHLDKSCQAIDNVLAHPNYSRLASVTSRGMYRPMSPLIVKQQKHQH
jgi:hypothetical protein